MVGNLYALKKFKRSVSGALVMVVTPRNDAKLVSVTAKFDTAPTTSEDFTIVHRYADGGEYSTQLLVTDPSVASNTDIFWQPDNEHLVAKSDSIRIAFTNTDARKLSVMVTMEVEQ